MLRYQQVSDQVREGAAELFRTTGIDNATLMFSIFNDLINLNTELSWTIHIFDTYR